MDKIKLGITVGDINGVGLEVILNALTNNTAIFKKCIPIIYGNTKVVSYHKNIFNEDCEFKTIKNPDRPIENTINVIDCWDENVKITLGTPSQASGKYAKISLEAASNDLGKGIIDAIVTAPFHKKAMNNTGFNYTGHTEFLTKHFGENDNSLMLMVNNDLRVGVATNHIPIKEVSEHLTKDLLNKKLDILYATLKRDFGKSKPLIAVLGLNPHSGDEGLLGKEDEEIIRPVIIQRKKNKKQLIFGPFAADGFFGSGEYKKYDGVLAMYHDQGLIPFKTIAQGSGVNFTAGIQIIRTSPDHGTGYDIAGKNLASHESFRNAVYLALDLYRERKNYDEMHENPVKKFRLK